MQCDANADADARDATRYWGRTTAGFSAVLEFLRGEVAEVPAEHFEEFVLLGLVRGADAPPPTVAAVNVGGKVFHARVDVLKRAGYFRQMLAWEDARPNADLRATFIDRSPKAFALLLRALEAPDEHIPAAAHPQADFFCVDLAPATCPCCRERPARGASGAAAAKCAGGASGARGHSACAQCGAQPWCPICLRDWTREEAASDAADASPTSSDRVPVDGLDTTVSGLPPPNALLPLVAQGEQNKHIHSDEGESLFAFKPLTKVKQHAFTYITEEMRNTHAGWQHTIPTWGRPDLMGDAYVTLDIVGSVSTDELFDGFIAFEWFIGGNLVDRYSGDALRVITNGTSAFECEFDGVSTRVVCPLKFCVGFSATSGKPRTAYLPLVALQYHEVKYTVVLSQGFAARCRRMTLTYNAVHVDTCERRELMQCAHVYHIYQHTEVRETFEVGCSSSSSSSSSSAGVARATPWMLHKHLHSICRMMVLLLKPRSDCHPNPLRLLTLWLNEYTLITLDHHLARKILPRERLGVADNAELMYYIPLDNTVNMSRFDSIRLDLWLTEGVYDAVLVVEAFNEMRINYGMAGMTFASM
jgi:hypothetical protein